MWQGHDNFLLRISRCKIQGNQNQQGRANAGRDVAAQWTCQEEVLILGVARKAAGDGKRSASSGEVRRRIPGWDKGRGESPLYKV